MRILFLDDDDNRHRAFSRWLTPGHDVVFVHTAAEAIQALTSQSFDIAFLDHDLGGEVMVTRVENTGYEVTLWMEAHELLCPAVVVLHSMNPSGRLRQQQALRGLRNVTAHALSFSSLMTTPCTLQA